MYLYWVKNVTKNAAMNHCNIVPVYYVSTYKADIPHCVPGKENN